jgi:hypothetical protein
MACRGAGTLLVLAGGVFAIMDCPINAVKACMFHARNKLRALVPVPGSFDC